MVDNRTLKFSRVPALCDFSGRENCDDAFEDKIKHVDTFVYSIADRSTLTFLGRLVGAPQQRSELQPCILMRSKLNLEHYRDISTAFGQLYARDGGALLFAEVSAKIDTAVINPEVCDRFASNVAMVVDELVTKLLKKEGSD